jgi:hypothetical protein
MEASVTTVASVAFELDRFESVDDERCEVEGRWFGVRGRRFMRPALTVVIDGRRARLLADLSHKPWAAEDGEAWVAAFPGLDGVDGLEEAELTVAPDINIALPAPKGRGAKRSAKSAARKEPARKHEPKSEPPGTVQLEADKARLAARIDELLDELSQARRRRDEAEALAEEAVSGRGELLTERDRLRAERDELRTERDRFAAELGEARRTADAAVQSGESAGTERDRALAEHSTAVAAREQAVSERDAAVRAGSEVLSERNAALAARDRAFAERDAALLTRDDALARADGLSQANERLHAQLANLTTSKGAALVMREAAQHGPVHRTDVGLVPRMLAVLALLAIVVVMLVIVRGA